MSDKEWFALVYGIAVLFSLLIALIIFIKSFFVKKKHFKTKEEMNDKIDDYVSLSFCITIFALMMVLIIALVVKKG